MKTEENIIKKIIRKYNETNLILRIVAGLVLGAVLGLLVPRAGWISVLGSLFVGALKAVAPLLVFVLVISSLANGKTGFDRRFRFVIFEIFPVTMKLAGEAAQAEAVPMGIGEVLGNLLMGMFTNPIAAITNGNYISILFWAVIFGILMRMVASKKTKRVFTDLSNILSGAVKWIINLAPFGILGLMFQNISENGTAIFADYGKLVLLLVASMLTVAFVINPLIVFVILRRNPYPLVLRCVRESGITALFTRSSAANIPVNMRLCERLGLDKDIYSVSIPLGATINMDGAAVVITIMTLATARTLGITVDFPSAVVLSILSTFAACGASGVAGGSLLLIPMACFLFGIPAEISMQVVGVGFIISVVQDSLETALNSSGDVVFTATAEYRHWQKEGRSLPTFLGGDTKLDI